MSLGRFFAVKRIDAPRQNLPEPSTLCGNDTDIMKCHFLLIPLVVIVASCVGTSAIFPQKDADYKPHEVIVKFKKATGQDKIDAVFEALNLQTIRTFTLPNLFLIKILDGKTVEETIKKLYQYHDVLYAEPNYTVRLTK